MAVVAFDGKQVRMLTSWTDNERELRRALSDAQARPAFGLQRLSELRSHERSLAGATTERSFDVIRDLPVEDRLFANQLAGKVKRSVGAAVATLRGFAQPPGRRVMLLLSGGWPFSPAAYAVGQRQVIETGQVPGGEEILRPLIDTANLTGYTVYPVDVPGLGTAGGADVEQGGRLATGLRVDGEERFADTAIAVGIDRESNLEDTLRFVAQETGGEALINARGNEALERAAQDTRSYYWLGFSPDRRRDDERHSIRVEVTRPGLRVRTRESYLDMSTVSERTMSVESALLFGDPAGEGGLGVSLGEPTRSGRRTMKVPLTIAIPTDAVAALPEGDARVVKLELRVAALDESSRQSEVPSVPLEMRFKSKPEAGKAIPYTTEVEVRRVQQVLVVSVTDVVGGRTLTNRVELAP
jgi:VWFA-related protein